MNNNCVRFYKTFLAGLSQLPALLTCKMRVGVGISVIAIILCPLIPLYYNFINLPFNFISWPLFISGIPLPVQKPFAFFWAIDRSGRPRMLPADAAHGCWFCCRIAGGNIFASSGAVLMQLGSCCHEQESVILYISDTI